MQDSSTREMTRLFRRAKREDTLFAGLTRSFALVVALSLAAILVSLLVGSWPAFSRFGPGFLWTNTWDPVGNEFGAAVAIFGTLVTSAIAILLAVPVSFGIAVFITELSPTWLKQPLGTAIELLAAIPSIIYGMWGLFVFAPWFGAHLQPWISDNLGTLPLVGALFLGPPVGIGLFTAGLVLSIMVIPFICAVMRDVFQTVPAELRESAYGLGSTTWEVVTRVVLPYTKTGVTGGIMLGLGRALGETMAVTFVIGNAQQISKSLFMPGNTISSTLANEFTEAVGKLYTSSLIALGLILFFISFVVLALARLMLRRLARREGVPT
jgi:phosphate transport system permease protein